MVKILGTSVNIIVAILYVYYCEINAEVDKLDFWEPNRKLDDTRRAQTKKKPVTPVNKTEKGPKLRVQDHVLFTRGFPMDLRISSPKHFPKNGRPHIEPILRIRENSNSDSDYATDMNRNRDKTQDRDKNKKNAKNHNADKHHKNDEIHHKNKTNQNMNKNHDAVKKHEFNKDHKDRNHNKDMNHKKDEDKKIDKDHEKDKDLKKDKDIKKDKELKKDKDFKKDSNYRKDKDRTKAKDRDSVMDHKWDRGRNNDKDDEKDKDYDKGKDHKRDKNYSKDMEHIKDNDHQKVKDHKEKKQRKNGDTKKDKEKDHNKDKDHHKDKKHDKNHQRTSDHGMQEMADKKNDQKTDKENKIKEKYNFKNRVKDIKVGGPMKLPTFKQQEYKQGQILDKNWPIHQHRSKIRTHKHRNNGEMHFIESTRMTPMYLMQQGDGEEGGDIGGGGGTKGPSLNHDDPSSKSYLSPYSLKSQIQEILDGFTNVSATIETLGRTVEYNDIIIAKIIQHSDLTNYFRAEESKYVDEVPEKKIIFIVHGLSVMGMQSVSALSEVNGMKIILSYYLAHLDKFDIYYMPMANPDGYAATYSKFLWNKNVSPQDACPGVAVDRNFDVAWNTSRVISSCSQLYPGPSPFSEVESKAVRDVFHYHGHKILAYIHVHAGTYSGKVFKGDAILYPRGYSESQSDDDKYIDLKGEIDEAMKNASFQVLSVTVDTLHNWYGLVTGTSVDYASSVYGIPYALEFVMQKYDGDDGHGQTNEFYAITEVWSRLIVTTFNNIWKSLHINNEVKKK